MVMRSLARLSELRQTSRIASNTRHAAERRLGYFRQPSVIASSQLAACCSAASDSEYQVENFRAIPAHRRGDGFFYAETAGATCGVLH
jgi:hypothetical protein